MVAARVILPVLEHWDPWKLLIHCRFTWLSPIALALRVLRSKCRSVPDRDCPELSWGLKGRRFSSSVL